MCVCVHTATRDRAWVCLFFPQSVVRIIGVGLKGGDLHNKMDSVCVALKWLGTHKYSVKECICCVGFLSILPHV